MPSPNRLLDWSLDPLDVLARWRADRPMVMLHSGRYEPRWARRSILAEPAGYYRFDPTPSGGRSSYVGSAPLPAAAGAFRHRPFADLRRLLAHAPGLWIGYISYEIARWIEKLPPRVDMDRPWPVIELAWCPGHLLFDLATERWYGVGKYASPGCEPMLDASAHLADFEVGRLESALGRSAYEKAVGQTLEYIAAGDVFQVNFAQRLTAPFHGGYPIAQRSVYGRLAAVSPAWYGGYLELGDGRVIASTSPELFLWVDETGGVITRPIKGTRPASIPADVLLHSEKDTAELNMIVDLMRNDLGRVCAYGSVKVTQPRVIESHPTIHHGVATITGHIHQDKDLIHLLRATMPGGSVTGAPKVRAMQIIDELEPARRGPYCGCIGYLCGRQACLNIAIRTMLLDAAAGRVDLSVGGGIVADSDPAGEYQETLDKAAAMRAALSQASVGDPVERDVAVADRLVV